MDYNYLYEIIGDKERVKLNTDIGEKYLSDGIKRNIGKAEALVFTISNDEVANVMRFAYENNISVTPRGAGTGLDLKDLIIGSEGTLAIITKAVLKLVPKPKKSISVLIPFSSLQDATDSVIKVINKNAKPTAIEFVERDVIENAEKYLNLKFPDDKGKACLLLTFDGDEEFEIEANYNKVKEVCLANGAIDFIVLDKSEDIERAWKIRGALVTAVEAVSEQEPIDIVVPINKTVDFISFTKEAEKQYGIKMTSFGHAGDGNVHLCVIRGNMGEAEWKEKSPILLAAIYEKSKELGGLPSGEHGIGLNKKPYFLKVTEKINVDYMKKIKGLFDNKNILNPDKAY